jgi:Zn-dependent M16 (insulinase) family peptidase
MQKLETNEGNKNAGVQLALYFQQNASKITSGYSILADSSLLKVVQTTLGISSYTSTENVDRQAAQFDKLLKYSDFSDSNKVRKFLERFTAQYDAANPSASASTIVSAVRSSSSTSVSFSVDLLMSLQNLKRGG